jgi:cell shape-determining protein MreC
LIARAEVPASGTVKEVTSEQIGTALRRLAADLVAERRRVALLERENQQLRAQLEALKRPAADDPEQRPSAI